MIAHVADNLALHKTATQISTYISPAGAAVDGVFNTAACTDDDMEYPWWAVDLGHDYDISSVTITLPETNGPFHKHGSSHCFINLFLGWVRSIVACLSICVSARIYLKSHTVELHQFLADRTIGRAYGTIQYNTIQYNIRLIES